ncbi:MAG: hypothetical protein NTW32_02685 [Chloroflexi bacterium]|nr:hypothetical protein [Chloroflexota bacterium]
MNRKIRFLMAALMVIVLAFSAGSVWAAQRLVGSVPEKPVVGTSAPVPTAAPLLAATSIPLSVGPGIPVTGMADAPGAVNMGTAIYAPMDPNVTITVTAVSNPAEIAPQPEGMAFVGDSFLLMASVPGALVQVCYAYPPEMEAKQAGIFRLNETLTPPAWEQVLGAVVGNGMICGSSTAGYVSLIGNS